MPWNSVGFISGMTTWFESKSANTEDETADEIARQYKLAASTVQPSTFFSQPISLNDASIISSGFKSAFNTAKNLQEGEMTESIWLSVSSSILLFWTGTTFTPLPPPPGGLIGATNSIIIPGLPSPLNIEILSAFKQNSPTEAALSLNAAFVNHLSTITGLWVGTAPGTPPPPFTFPWVGLI